MSRIRHFENFHILLWLIKDSAWLMEWKLTGLLMIVPTIGMAINIAYWSRVHRDPDFWLQLAVVCWISANSYWMCCEFFSRVDLKNYAAIPFMIGLVCTAVHYLPVIFSFTKKKAAD